MARITANKPFVTSSFLFGTSRRTSTLVCDSSAPVDHLLYVSDWKKTSSMASVPSMDLENLPGINEDEETLEASLIEEIAKPTRDTRISDTFYHFEELTNLGSGRTVGRKIGVVQEIVLRKYIEQSDALKRRMYLEQKLEGISGASHKVEFSWYAIDPVAVKANEKIGSTGLNLLRVSPDKTSVVLQLGTKTRTVKIESPEIKTGPIRSHLNSLGLDLRLRSIEKDRVHFDIVDRTSLLASLESKRVGAQRFSGSEKLGSGIQTIEKAKQASLVAIDLDLKVNGTVKPLQDSNADKQLLSFVALGNGVHWTEKDKAVLGTFVDFTYLVPDKSIIRYAEYVKAKAPANADIMKHFMDYFKGMTVQVEDDFQVFDDDFEIIVPTDEARSLKEILEQHCQRVNPL